MPMIKETDTTLNSYIVTPSTPEVRALKQAERERQMETVIRRHPTRRVRFWDDEPVVDDVKTEKD